MNRDTMFEETDDIRARAEPIEIDKTPQTTKLGIEIHEIDQHGQVDTLELLVNGNEIHQVMPGFIAELVYGYAKTDLRKDGQSIKSAHNQATEFTKELLANDHFGMSEEQVDKICSTHLDDKLEADKETEEE